LPGYLSELDQIPDTSSLNHQILKSIGIKNLSVIISEANYKNNQSIFIDLALELGVHFKFLFSNSKEGLEAVKNNEIDIGFYGTGFWAVDPFGDIQMLFTKGLHPVLKDIAADDKLQDMLEQLNSAGLDNPQELAKRVNKYIHDSYIYNVYANYPIVYLLQGFDEKYEYRIPQSGATPYPWMFFND
jgi:hypothetical protein